MAKPDRGIRVLKIHVSMLVTLLEILLESMRGLKDVFLVVESI